MRIWSMTDTGLVREENQDAYAAWQTGEYTAAVVCDGMGGTSGGQVASRIAVETYQQELSGALQDGMSFPQVSQTVLYSVARANAAIRKEAQTSPEYENMGTTLVSAVCRGAECLVCNIGDSRAYRINVEGIEQISKDHSVVENMVERGEITAAEARKHPNRNLITRALGPDEKEKADVFPIIWPDGEFLLLCTDGLVNTVSDQEILFEIIHAGNVEDCLRCLFELAQKRGAPDNLTAVLVENH